jgi:peptidoglycan-associated lipoprotein
MRKMLSIALFAAALPLVGCGDDKPPAKTAADTKPAPSATASTSRLPKEAPNSPTASALRISDEIVKACGITDPGTYFAFDSANIRPEDSTLLQQIATCFVTGPLKDRVMKLVGHADPRGSQDYNMTLGQSRADAVAVYMVGKGMDRDKAKSSSRGADDATGTDEPSWARDRRVDMLLGQ